VSRAAKVLLGLALLLGAVPLALYGVFAIGYEGDPYIKFGGGEVDADLAGAIALAIAAVAVSLAIVLLRSGKASARSNSFAKPS
jgi:glycerol-3-phosphate acyltransferase PlsY